MRGWHRPPEENEYITIELSYCLLTRGGDFVTKMLSSLCPYNRLYAPTLICSSLPYFSYPYKEGNHTVEGTKESDREEGGTYDTQDFVPLLSTVQMTTSMGIIINHHNSSPTFAYDKILSHYCLLPIIFLARYISRRLFSIKSLLWAALLS